LCLIGHPLTGARPAGGPRRRPRRRLIPWAAMDAIFAVIYVTVIYVTALAIFRR
jgi:hypothetical protein